MIYTIENFEICPATGNTATQICYDLGMGKKRINQSYRNYQSAYEEIEFQMRHTLYFRYSAYINNCKDLYEGGYGVTQTIARDQAFAFFKANLTTLWERPLHRMCMNIEALREKLHTILPAKSHSRYIQLHNEAIELVVFAKHHKAFNLDTLIKEEIAA